MGVHDILVRRIQQIPCVIHVSESWPDMQLSLNMCMLWLAILAQGDTLSQELTEFLTHPPYPS